MISGPDHFQSQIDASMAKANEREQATLHERPIDRLALERRRMRAPPRQMPPTEPALHAAGVAPAPLRFDTNDYSIDPRAVGRRIEVRIGRRPLLAACLDSGKIVA